MLRLIQNQLFESICARNICLRSVHDYTRHTVFVFVFESITHMVVVVVIWRKGSKPAISDHILGTNLPPVCQGQNCTVFLVCAYKGFINKQKVNILIPDVCQHMLLMICTSSTERLF